MLSSKKLKVEYKKNYLSFYEAKRGREIKHRKQLREISENEERQEEEKKLFEEILYPKLSYIEKEEFPYEVKEFIPDDFELSDESCRFEPYHWYLALEDLDSPIPLHGRLAVNIVLPENINVAYGNWGDNKFFKII